VSQSFLGISFERYTIHWRMRASLVAVTPENLSSQDDAWHERPKNGYKKPAPPTRICNVRDSLLPERLHPACHLHAVYLSSYLGSSQGSVPQNFLGKDSHHGCLNRQDESGCSL